MVVFRRERIQSRENHFKQQELQQARKYTLKYSENQITSGLPRGWSYVTFLQAEGRLTGKICLVHTGLCSSHYTVNISSHTEIFPINSNTSNTFVFKNLAPLCSLNRFLQLIMLHSSKTSNKLRDAPFVPNFG